MSVAEDIAAAGATVVASAGGIAAAVRDTPDVLDGDTLPMVVVSMLDESFEPLTLESERGSYLMVATLVQQRAGKVKAGAAARAWRENVRVDLSDHQAVSDAVPAVWGCRVIRRAVPFPREGLKAELRYTTVAIEYWTTEPRG